MYNPKNYYQRRLTQYIKLFNKHTRVANNLSNFRLSVFIAGYGAAIAFFLYHKNLLGGIIFLITTIGFAYLVIKHGQVLRNKNYSGALTEINKRSLQRLEGEWKAFQDTGEEFFDKNHSYSEDLDIFGRGSLFQWINSAHTFLGRLRLKEMLTNPLNSENEIYARQAAIQELASHLTWRQRFEAEGFILSGDKNPDKLFYWADQQYIFYAQSWVKLFFRILPALTIILGLLYLFHFSVPFYIPLGFILLQSIILFSSGKERSMVFEAVCGHAEGLKSYRYMLKHIEKKHFSSDLLRALQANLLSRKKERAFAQVDKLSKIADAITNRNNAMFLLINILLLWDFQCMIALEDWKQNSGRHLKKWLQTIGEFEALSCLAIIKFDNPDWSIPKIIPASSYLMAKGMGHPLITKERVCNDLKIQPSSSILLITGSNMSGKSTLLRTAGINLVLAYAGAPVCAEEFKCSIMKVYTCMRVSDDLEKNISSFYAELLRIKNIVQAAKEEQIFFLLDEIFKGTNSQDRHTGAKVLIKQLSKQGSTGMVSTHDLELGDLEQESGGAVKNYHFKEYYQNGQIQFDYKLRSGISTTRNALYLIKLAGIEMEVD